MGHMKGALQRGGTHPIQVGLRMVEEFRLRCKEVVEEDPLRAVAVVYEEELTKIKTQLDDGNLEEFTALCPTLSALSPSLYSWRSACIPPTPEFQQDIIFDNRFTRDAR